MTTFRRLLDDEALRPWGTRYFVVPPLPRETGLDAETALERIEPHRLDALVVEDVERYPDSPAADVHRRVGPELGERTVQRALKRLVDAGRISAKGETRWRRYGPARPIRHDTWSVG